MRPSPFLLVRSIRSGDEEQVRKVAAGAFQGYYGHYHADPKLDPAKCDAGYVEWAVRSCTSREVASEVLVAERDSQIIGFATLRLNAPEEGEILLLAVIPQAQRARIGGALLTKALHWCHMHNTQRMIISTQIVNIAAQKVWCRVGFEPLNSYNTFHKWF